MQSSLPGPLETLVSSTHGNEGFSDAAAPVTIAHDSQGAIISPSSQGTASISPLQSLESKQVEPVLNSAGKVHYVLPTLPIPDEKNSFGSLVNGIVSTALHIDVAPHSSEWYQDRSKSHEQNEDNSKLTDIPSPTAQGISKITTVDIYAGRELLWSSARLPNGQQVNLPANQDVRLHVSSDIWPGNQRQFNGNAQGLGVTLTIEFRGEAPTLMISSIALVQKLQRVRQG